MEFDTKDYLYQGEPPIESFGRKVYAELRLVSGAAAAIAHGAGERVDELIDHPFETARIATEGIVVGGGITMLVRRGPLSVANFATHILPKIAVVAGGVDLAQRVGRPMFDTWQDPAAWQLHEAQLGRSVGSMLVDYTAYGVTGFVGAKATMSALPRFSPQASLLDADLPALEKTIARALRAHGGQEELATSIAEELGGYGARRGLPRASIKFGNLDLSGVYRPGQGSIHFDLDTVTRRKGPATEVIAHEYAHFEQDVNVVRALADDLQIGKKASAAQLGQLAERYSTVMGREIRSDFADEILRLRNGEPLTSSNKERARSMVADGGGRFGFDVYTAYDTARVLEKEGILTSGYIKSRPAMASRLMEQARNGWYHKTVMFGSEEIPAHFGAIADERVLQAKMIEHMNQRLPELGRARRVALDNYRGLLPEREAYMIGNSARYQSWMKNPLKPIATFSFAAPLAEVAHAAL